MERLQQRIKTAEKALNALSEALKMPKNTIVRDAAIQRFEFSVEAVWKLGQIYLRIKEGLDLASPKQVFRSCFEIGLLEKHQTEISLRMIDDRNLTVHTYDEELSELIFSRITEYAQIMTVLLESIRNNV